MRIFSKIKQFFQNLCHRQNTNVPCQPYTFQTTSQHGCYNQPNILPLESNYKLTSIAGTNLSIGNIETVSLTDQEQLITTSNNIGILCGCNHHVYRIKPENGLPGLGGQCQFCLADLLPLVQQNSLPAEKIQAMTLFCTDCASLCHMCATVICLRHASAYPTPNGVLFLCPNCAKKYEDQRFLNKTLMFLLSPILEKPQPDQNQNGGNYEV
jgi:hypothetical protein